MTTNIKDLFNDNQLNNADTFSAVIQCDFNPFKKNENIFSNTSLARLNDFLQSRKFETKKALRLAQQSGISSENIVQYASHQKIFGEEVWEKKFDSVEGKFTDKDFPPEKESIMGLGFNDGEPRDSTAYKIFQKTFN